MPALDGGRLERRWERRGGPSRADRWFMRHPVASGLIQIPVVVGVISVLEWVVTPLFGRSGQLDSGLVLTTAGLLAVLVPFQLAAQRQAARRYEAWRAGGQASGSG